MCSDQLVAIKWVSSASSFLTCSSAFALPPDLLRAAILLTQVFVEIYTAYSVAALHQKFNDRGCAVCTQINAQAVQLAGNLKKFID